MSDLTRLSKLIESRIVVLEKAALLDHPAASRKQARLIELQTVLGMIDGIEAQSNNDTIRLPRSVADAIVQLVDVAYSEGLGSDNDAAEKQLLAYLAATYPELNQDYWWWPAKEEKE